MKSEFLFFLFCIITVQLAAQDVNIEEYEIDKKLNPATTPVSGFFDAGISFALPQPELQKAVDNNVGGLGFGFSAGFGVNPFGKKRSSLLLVGLDFTYHTYGRDKIEGNNVSPPLKTTFNQYLILPRIRVYAPFQFSQKFFLEANGGLQVFSARTKIDKTAFDTLNDEQPELINSENDTGLAYGVFIGTHSRKAKVSDLLQASFQLKAGYFTGETLRYVKRGSVQVDADGFINYETGYTQPAMFVIQLGVILH